MSDNFEMNPIKTQIKTWRQPLLYSDDWPEISMHDRRTISGRSILL